MLPGTDLTGGGNSGVVTLNIDLTKIPQLNAANAFNGNQSAAGNLSASALSGNGAGLTNVNANSLGGLASGAFAQLSAGNNSFAGSVNASAFFGDGSGLTHVNANSLGGLASGSFAQLGAGSNNFSGSLSAALFSGSGAGLVNLNPANLSGGTANINISGNAGSALFANNANTASDALSLGGLPSGAFAQLAANANNFSGNVNASTLSGNTLNLSGPATLNSNLSVSGALAGTKATFSGPLSAMGALLPPQGTATSGTPASSNALDLFASSWNGTNAVNEQFRWQAEGNGSSDSGTLNLLSATGGNALSETGLLIAGNGQVTFAPGQTFPGAGTPTITGITAGTGLTGGGTSGNVTLGVANGFFVNNGTAPQNASFNITGASTAGSYTSSTYNFGAERIIDGNPYLTLSSGNNSSGGIQLFRNDGNRWGYLYGDNSGFGLLGGSGNWLARGTGSINAVNTGVELWTNNAARFTIDGSGNATLSGNFPTINGTTPPNGAIRMTPNFHLNSGSGNAVILNWDNGTTGTNQTLRVGNGQASDAFYVLANGNHFFGASGNPNPTFSTISGSYWVSPSGAYFSSGTVYFATQSQHRGGVNNDQGTLTLTGSNGVVNLASTYFQVAGKYAIDGSDGYLRLNQQNSFPNGIYTPYAFQTDNIIDSNGLTSRNGAGDIGTNTRPWINVYANHFNGNKLEARNLGVGNAFIGTLDTNGVGLLPGFTGTPYPVLGSTGADLYVSIGGVYAAYFSTGGVNNISDERMKTDVRDLGTSDFRDALASLDKIRSVRFRYKQEVGAAKSRPDLLSEAPLHIGVIAQSLPESVVNKNQQLGILGMSQADMIGFLVASLRGVRNEAKDLNRETQEQVQKLLAQVGILEQQNADLGQQNDAKDRALREQAAQMNAIELRLKLLEQRSSTPVVGATTSE